MLNQEYLTLMESVSGFAKKAGLNTDNLYSDTYEPKPSGQEKWNLSVSWKTLLGNSCILYSSKDELKPDFDNRLYAQVITDSKEQIRAYEKKAQEKGAEYFSKKVVALAGVEPSPEFLALSTVEQVEYALHEAFHNTLKTVSEKETPHLPWDDEEAAALVVGYIGAIHFFKGTELEDAAIAHWQKYLGLASSVNRLYKELDETLGFGFRVDEHRHQMSQERILQERDEVLERARQELGDKLGGPINNAFFVYWHYFYGDMEKMYGKVKEMENLETL
ncbi:Uncharacterised protein [uncultured archaeon]|nr:Uncharacterised protein [uncultured archaeon]